MNLFDAIKMSEHEAALCWDKIKEYLFTTNQTEKLERLGNVPPIIWSKFGFTTAGRYCYTPNTKKDKVEMNINYLNIEDPVKFIINTTRHELAHCLNFRIGSKKNHDNYWKQFATILGDDANIYHDYGKPSNAPVKTKTFYSLHCTCGIEFHLSKRRFTMAKNGRYLCKNCGNNLSKLFDSNDTLID